MTQHRRAQVVIYALDPGRVAPFYAEVVGFHVIHTEDSHVTLGSDWMELHVVRAPAEHANRIEMFDPPQRREETPIKVSFLVANIQAARDVAGRLGGVIDGAETEWTWRGESHCDGHDPEGNVFQVRDIQP
jgi:predicted enzyme related to lactoylglutathione lyase